MESQIVTPFHSRMGRQDVSDVASHKHDVRVAPVARTGTAVVLADRTL